MFAQPYTSLCTEWIFGWETQESEGDIDHGGNEDIAGAFRVDSPAAVRRLCLSKVAQEAGLPLRLNRLADHVGDEHVLRGDDGTPRHFTGDATVCSLQAAQKGDSTLQLWRRSSCGIFHGYSPLLKKRTRDCFSQHTIIGQC